MSASSFYMKSMTYGSIQAVNFTTFALTLAEINLLSELAHQEDRYHPSRTTRTIYDPRLLDKLVKLTLKLASGYCTQFELFGSHGHSRLCRNEIK